MWNVYWLADYLMTENQPIKWQHIKESIKEWRGWLEVKIKKQNVKERGFRWLWMCHGYGARLAGLSIFRNCWPTVVFTHNHLSVFAKNGSKRLKVCGRKCLLMPEVREEWTDWLKREAVITTCYNHARQSTTFKFKAVDELHIWWAKCDKNR